MVPVLILEDDELLGGLIRRAIELAGFEAHWYAHYEDALREIYRVSPKVVFVDFALEEENGLIFFQKVKKDFPNSKFYLLSGFIDREDIPSFLEEGFDDVFLKPVSMEKLVELVSKAEV